MSRSTKKDYPRKFDSRRFDYSCRCHGSCSYCKNTRLFFDEKERVKLEGQVDEWFGYWNLSDSYDADTNAYDERLKQIGVSPWDFDTRRELDV